MTSIDFRNYVQSVAFYTHHATPLAERLTRAAPADADPHERAALERIVSRAGDLAEVLSERDRASPAGVRPFLSVFTSAWSGIHDALAALVHVDPTVSNRGARAAGRLATLFPESVAFVKLDAHAAWSEGRRRLYRIEHEDMRADLEQLIGADLLETAIRATEKLGHAIGVGNTEVREAPSSTALREHRLAFSQAVAAYCRLLAAKVIDPDDSPSVERFMSAVAPIDDLRVTRERGVEDEEEPEPVAPAPTPLQPETP